MVHTYGMALMEYRTTFALDAETMRRLKKLAAAWRVSQAEVVRRTLERAERENDEAADSPLRKLREYHEAGGLDSGLAAAYAAEAAESRSEWRRNG